MSKRTRGQLLAGGGAILAIVAALAGLRQLARARSVQLFGGLVARVTTAERRVALTFDDGPARGPLEELLLTATPEAVSLSVRRCVMTSQLAARELLL